MKIAENKGHLNALDKTRLINRRNPFIFTNLNHHKHVC
jgi:hypothetical protein